MGLRPSSLLRGSLSHSHVIAQSQAFPPQRWGLGAPKVGSRVHSSPQGAAPATSSFPEHCLSEESPGQAKNQRCGLWAMASLAGALSLFYKGGSSPQEIC